MPIEFVLLALAAGALQTLFYSRQLRRVNALFVELRRRGPVLVGRKQSALRGGAMVILRLTESRRIAEAYVIEGYTAFARIRPYEAVVGRTPGELAAEGAGALGAAFRDAAERYAAAP